MSGIDGSGCDEHADKCPDANGTYTFTRQPDGSYVTSPTKDVCGLYNWELICTPGETLNDYRLTHMNALVEYTGQGSSGSSIVLTLNVNNDSDCTGWPSTITLTAVV